MKTMTREQKKILRQVRDHILAEPKRLRMSKYITTQKTSGLKTFHADSHRNEEVPFAPCGTAGCIAGWAVILSTPNIAPFELERTHPYDLMVNAAKILGITDTSLFFVEEWPRRFSKPYMKAKTQKTRAKYAAKMINYWLRTH